MPETLWLLLGKRKGRSLSGYAFAERGEKGRGEKLLRGEPEDFGKNKKSFHRKAPAGNRERFSVEDRQKTDGDGVPAVFYTLL